MGKIFIFNFRKKKDDNKIAVDMDGTCSTCLKVTLDNREFTICYATGEELLNNKKCTCGAYEFSGQISTMIKR